MNTKNTGANKRLFIDIALGTIVIGLLAANWYMWSSIQTKIAILEQEVAEQKETLQENMANRRAERPSREERAEILSSLKQNPEGLSMDERRAILNGL